MKTSEVILVNSLVLVGGLLLLELVFGSWFGGSRWDRIVVPKGIRSEYTDIHGNTTTYVRDRFGLRGHYADISRIDILTLGGSTTDQLYIDEGKTWQDVLSGCLSERLNRKISVVNAGVDGQSTYGNRMSLDLWLSDIPRLHARYIAVYAGINDYFTGRSGQNTNGVLLTHEYLFKKSAVYRAYRVVSGMFYAHRVKLRHGMVPLQLQRTGTLPVSEVEKMSLSDSLMPPTVISTYRENLLALDRRIRSFGALPIFISQRTMTFRIRNGTVENYQGPEAGFRSYKIYKAMSATMMDVCRKTGARCIDAGFEIDFVPADYSDVIHNTASGTRKIGEYLCEKLGPSQAETRLARD